VHYKDVAEHLAKRCRKALNATARPPYENGGLWVGMPIKNTDRLRTRDSYSFGVGEVKAGRVREVGPREEYYARFIWRAYVIVYKNREIEVQEETGHVPMHVAACMLAGP